MVTKKSPLTAILTVVLFLSALTSVVSCYFAIQYSREMRSLQYQFNYGASRRVFMNTLGNDLIEYSKTHPAIDPLLESVGIKSKPALPVPGKSIK